MDSEFALTYKDSSSGDRSYLATVCGSAKIYKGCGVSQASINQAGFGSVSQSESPGLS